MISDYTINRFQQSELLCLDIETRDPKLLTEGPGTHRKDGHICGIGFATKDSGKFEREYLSFTHPDTPGEQRQYNRNVALDLLKGYNAKIGANIAYDCEWLEHEGFKVNGKTNDVQYAEPLLNEYKRSYSLNNIATSYGLKGKATDVLKDYNSTMGWKGEPIANIWRMPEKIAAEYALVDVELPLDIFERQKRNLETQNLMDLYNLETDLIPVLLRMRKNGVRLDMPKMRKTSMKIAELHWNIAQEITHWAGHELNFNSTAQLAKVFDAKGIPYPRNPPTAAMIAKGRKEGNPNLDKSVLNRLAAHQPICKKILQYRHFTTLLGYLQSYGNLEVGGRLYGQFHPLRNDEYGTVAGRFSASKPNLQQVSAKEEAEEGLTGQVIRELYIPDEGRRWAKLDYSQVEYRIMAHYAVGDGSEELRRSYNEHKEMDYHQRIMDSTGFTRRIAKNVNFGGMYGIGMKTASTLFGWTMDDAEVFLNGYHKNAPYIRETRGLVSNTASRRGYIYTLLNRKARVHSSRKLHSMFNRLIQGSAADIMKKAMVDAEKQGLFDVLNLHMTVHDELDVSYEDTKEGNEALIELKNTMETTYKLSVPILVDCHTGANWAEAD